MVKIHRILSLCAALVMCTALSGCAEKSEVPLADSAAQTSPQTAQSTAQGSVSGVSSESAAVSSVKVVVSSADGTSGVTNASSAPVQSSAARSSDIKTATSPVHDHKYSAETVAPTCTEAGYTVYTCFCGDRYTSDTVEASGHDYEKDVTEPTCKEGGYTVYTCGKCGHSYKEDIAARGHSYSSETVAPTCSEGGYTIHTCDICGDEYKDGQVSASGHGWGEWSVYRAPTVSAEGERRRVCSRCGETQSEPIARLVSEQNYADRVVELVNAERAKYGLSPLSARSDLTEYAQIRSTEIVSRFEHVRLDGSSPLSYVLGLSGIHSAGENIAWGQTSPEDVMNAWMNSEGHRNNILASKYTTIGVGCYKSGGTLYWTQIFGG